MSDSRPPTITRTTITVITKRHGTCAPISTEAYSLVDARELAQERAKPLHLPIIEIDADDLENQTHISDGVFIATKTEVLVAKERVF
jgi:hypothetical protein